MWGVHAWVDETGYRELDLIFSRPNCACNGLGVYVCVCVGRRGGSRVYKPTHALEPRLKGERSGVCVCVREKRRKCV